ncbi:transcription repressor OFP17-like [Primulina eburnea]|uniref:transcription repressor OFP17-like n=1 Tax=Primulina eburnea TaxID=1245227 RepID=UPI003C6C879D
MGLKNLSHFRCKLTKPCKKLFKLFKFKLHKPLFISTLRLRPHRKPNMNNSTRKGRRHLSKILPVLCSLTRTKEMDRTTEFTSFSDPGQRIAPHPSPLTPAYVRMRAEAMGKVDVSNQYAACRSFENHLTELIVGEGKMRDLEDVEEFLYCWKKLRCPVFMDLVCRFYGELCRDLFSNAFDQNEIGLSKEYLRYN